MIAGELGCEPSSMAQQRWPNRRFGPTRRTLGSMFFKQHPVLTYTLGRIGLFLAVFGMLALAGARGLLLIALAFLLSGLLSLIMLDGPRSGMSQRVAGYFGRINDRIEEASRAEDDQDKSERTTADVTSADVSDPEGRPAEDPSVDQGEAKSDSQASQ